MTPLTRVLCPIDFSEASRGALAYAVALARRSGARLTVQHVYGIPVVNAALLRGTAPPEVEAAVFATMGEGPMFDQLQIWAEAAGASDLPIDRQVVEGDPADCIVAAAKQADLVVVGTHGRTGLARLALGSVAESVLRRAPCSVLTVPRGAARVSPPLFPRILAATDFSPAAERAVRFAVSLATEENARLILLHVLEVGPPDWLYGRAATELLAEATAAARERLADAVPKEARPWCQVDTRLETGNPSERIVALAREEDASVIVLGVHRHGVIDRALFGTTPQQVVRAAATPVLVVRP